jgi:hypothetical protein
MTSRPLRWRYGSDDSREAVWGQILKGRHDELVQEPLPDKMRELLEQLQKRERASDN